MPPTTPVGKHEQPDNPSPSKMANPHQTVASIRRYTQAAYCRKNRLKLHQFVYWRSKLTTATTNEPDNFADKTGSCFVPVVMEQAARAELTVTLPNRLRIEGIGCNTIALA